jgi:hypothetical protein
MDLVDYAVKVKASVILANMSDSNKVVDNRKQFSPNEKLIFQNKLRVGKRKRL